VALELDDLAEIELARMIATISRDLAHSVPAPRGAPFFGLDSGVRYDLRAFDALAIRGIFRKYEMVLELGCGLGGRARSLAAAFGCRIVGTDARVGVVAGARLLNLRAAMDSQVFFDVGCPESLPFRERVFTHVWILDPRAAPGSATLVDMFRVLRRGGHVAIHTYRSSVPALADALHTIGFVEAQSHHLATSELSHTLRVAEQRLAAVLSSSQLELFRGVLQLPGPEADVVQVSAHRPA